MADLYLLEILDEALDESIGNTGILWKASKLRIEMLIFVGLQSENKKASIFPFRIYTLNISTLMIIPSLNSKYAQKENKKDMNLRNSSNSSIKYA